MEELRDSALTPRELVAVNAAAKALEVASRFPGRVVLAADTEVALNRVVFGKPADNTEALSMLLALSGNTHEVFTGVHLELFDPQAGSRSCKFVEVTRVRFRSFGATEAEAYLNDVPVLDKAGAYAAQDDHGRLIETIEGCRDSVIGLPVDRVLAALRMHFSGVVLLPGQ